MDNFTKITGGPAFPASFEESSCLSVLDYFAARAPEMPKWWFEHWLAKERAKAKMNDRYIMRGEVDAWAEWSYEWAKSHLKKKQEIESFVENTITNRYE